MTDLALSHTAIWSGIDRLATSFGYSPSGLAKKSGLDPTSFNKSKRVSPDGKPRWPSTESISKVLAATGATMSDLISLIDAKENIITGSASFDKKQIARESAKILLDTKSVLFNTREPFKYTSGNTGPVYVDCRRPLSFVKERTSLIDFAARLLISEIGVNNIDAIAGGETAGIPYAAFLSERLQKPMLYVRKKPKGGGRMSQIEGHFENGTNPKILLVEDLQNYGTSKKIFVDALRKAGAQIEHFFTLFDYGIRPEVAGINQDMGLTAHHLCNWQDILKSAKENNSFDDKTLKSVENFLNDPDHWKAD